LLWRAGDLRARFLLNDLATREYERSNFDGACTLIHAERHLADRLAYELQPWPKGMIRDEDHDPVPPSCPHCGRLIIEPSHCSECKRNFCGIECCMDHEHSGAAGVQGKEQA